MISLSALPRLRAGALFPMLFAKLQENCERELWRRYVAAGIKMVSENTARFAGGGYLAIDYDDIINPKPKDERTGDEIVLDVIQRTGIKVT